VSDPWLLVEAVAVFGCLADSHRPSAPVLAVQLSPMRAHLHLLL
jgi:hypothetical protein